MKFYISYGKGKPGTVFETFEAEQYHDACSHAADNAHGWGFSVANKYSADYVVKLNGEEVFYTHRREEAEDFASRILTVENEMKKRNIFWNTIDISVEEC